MFGAKERGRKWSTYMIISLLKILLSQYSSITNKFVLFPGNPNMFGAKERGRKWSTLHDYFIADKFFSHNTLQSQIRTTRKIAWAVRTNILQIAMTFSNIGPSLRIVQISEVAMERKLVNLTQQPLKTLLIIPCKTVKSFLVCSR